jgi:hypothetical protein
VAQAALAVLGGTLEEAAVVEALELLAGLEEQVGMDASGLFVFFPGNKSNKIMKYNNGKIPAVGDKVIVKMTDQMVAGVVTAISAPNNIYVSPVQVLTQTGAAAGPNQVVAWPGSNPPSIFVSPGYCLLESDIPFGTPPPNPPL